MKSNVIQIASEYSAVPAGRYREDGPFSAQVFRDDLLIPRLRNAILGDEILTVKLDGLLGVSSSFLEEAFGGLIRCNVFGTDQIVKHLHIDADSRAYQWAIKDAEKYMAEAMKLH